MHHFRIIRGRSLTLLLVAATALAGDVCSGQTGCDTTCCDQSTSACARATLSRIGIDPATNRTTSGRALSFGNLHEPLERIRARWKTPALAAAVWQAGRITASGVAGVRVAGSVEPVMLEDRFHFGSCGKAMTATLAGILVEDGFISWSSTIEDVFPDLAREIRDEYRAATLRQLLSHRAGFPPDRPSELETLEGPLCAQRRALVAIVGKLDPVGMPGAVFQYTDLGYSVAGAMLERRTGRSWEELIVEYLAEPLGIDSLGFGAPGAGAERDQPWGHVLRGDVLQGITPGPGADGAVPAIGPAGTLHASITDWATFAALHLDARVGAERPLLEPRSLETLHADHYDQGYALGWGLQRIDGRVDLVHSGSCGRWAALVRVIPEQNTAIVVASNYGGQSAFLACSEAMAAILEQYGKAR